MVALYFGYALIDDIFGHFVRHIIYEAGGGIDREGGANEHKQIGAVHDGNGLLDHGYGFFEPHYMGAVAAAIGRAHIIGNIGGDGVELVFIALAAHFQDLAMEVEDVLRASTLVEVIDILGNDVDVVMLLQGSQGKVGGIGLCGQYISPAHVVEGLYEGGIAAPGAGCGYVFNVVAFPQAIAIAEGAETAFGTDAGAGEYYECLFHGI